MLYSEFLNGTEAVDNEATYAERTREWKKSTWQPIR